MKIVSSFALLLCLAILIDTQLHFYSFTNVIVQDLQSNINMFADDRSLYLIENPIRC